MHRRPAALLAALALCASSACRNTGGRNEQQPAPAPAPLASASASTPVPKLPTQDFDVAFHLRPGKVRDSTDLVVVVPSLPDTMVGTVDARERCDLVKVGTPLVNPDGSQVLRRGVKWTCSRFEVPVWREGDVLRIADKTYPLAKETFVRLPEKVQTEPRRDCPRSRSRTYPEARLERRAAGPEPDAPWVLGVHIQGEFIELGRLPRVSMRCSGNRLSSTRSTIVQCEYGTEAIQVWLVATRGELSVKWLRQVETFAGSSREREFSLDLGCEVELRFLRPFTLRDADFKPYVPTCAELCAREQRDCIDNAYLHCPDHLGSIEGATECLEYCAVNQKRCPKDRCGPLRP